VFGRLAGVQPRRVLVSVRILRVKSAANHLDPLLGEILNSGNSSDLGWQRDRDGWFVALREPIAFGELRLFPAPRLRGGEQQDEITCTHCWARIIGGWAAAKSLAMHESWKQFNATTSSWEAHALRDPDGSGYWYVEDLTVPLPARTFVKTAEGWRYVERTDGEDT
jgi:hypothetical protein